MTSVPDREDQLREACRGIDLDATEERILGWLATMTDAATCKTIASILEKVREAGYLTQLTERTPVIQFPVGPAGTRGRYIPGNSGPGF